MSRTRGDCEPWLHKVGFSAAVLGRGIDQSSATRRTWASNWPMAGWKQPIDLELGKQPAVGTFDLTLRRKEVI
jgi:hypothetical protein